MNITWKNTSNCNSLLITLHACMNNLPKEATQTLSLNSACRGGGMGGFGVSQWSDLGTPSYNIWPYMDAPLINLKIQIKCKWEICTYYRTL